MTKIVKFRATLVLLALVVALSMYVVANATNIARATSSKSEDVSERGTTPPLKDAKLNIEHNATDEDTGFQGFIDSEGSLLPYVDRKVKCFSFPDLERWRSLV